MTETNRQRILVFAERGTDPEILVAMLRDTYPGVDILRVTRRMLDEDRTLLDPEKTLAFCLPGAREAEYDTKLGPENIERLRNFVHGGGSFLGICAGAAHASADIDWFREEPHRAIRKKASIKFFNYLARGPIGALTEKDLPDPTNSLRYTAAPAITFHGEGGDIETEILYWGGPELIPLDEKPKATILARFNSVAGNPPAILFDTYGKGRMVISAIHPEVRGAIFRRCLIGDSPAHLRAFDIARTVERNERARGAIWREIMTKLLPALTPA